MPFKSKSQRRWMHAAEARGEVPKGTAKKWEEHTPRNKPLPEKIEKTAFEIGFEKKASTFGHAAELAGLGILAAPSVSALAGKKWDGKNKDIAEVGGLGILAAPSIAHFVAKNKKLAPYLKHLV